MWGSAPRQRLRDQLGARVRHPIHWPRSEVRYLRRIRKVSVRNRSGQSRSGVDLAGPVQLRCSPKPAEARQRFPSSSPSKRVAWSRSPGRQRTSMLASPLPQRPLDIRTGRTSLANSALSRFT
jgi:hypothetical protein